jgi:hypothetical protein
MLAESAMLQKGLSNRPSGAVALLIVAGSLVLNFIRGENIVAERLWGGHSMSLAKLSCYAQQAACHVRYFFEDAVIGPRQDLGYEKKSRKVVEINAPSLERANSGLGASRKSSCDLPNRSFKGSFPRASGGNPFS